MPHTSLESAPPHNRASTAPLVSATVLVQCPQCNSLERYEGPTSTPCTASFRPDVTNCTSCGACLLHPLGPKVVEYQQSCIAHMQQQLVWCTQQQQRQLAYLQWLAAAKPVDIPHHTQLNEAVAAAKAVTRAECEAGHTAAVAALKMTFAAECHSATTELESRHNRQLAESTRDLTAACLAKISTAHADFEARCAVHQQDALATAKAAADTAQRETMEVHRKTDVAAAVAAAKAACEAQGKAAVAAAKAACEAKCKADVAAAVAAAKVACEAQCKTDVAAAVAAAKVACEAQRKADGGQKTEPDALVNLAAKRITCTQELAADTVPLLQLVTGLVEDANDHATDHAKTHAARNTSTPSRGRGSVTCDRDDQLLRQFAADTRLARVVDQCAELGCLLDELQLVASGHAHEAAEKDPVAGNKGALAGHRTHVVKTKCGNKRAKKTRKNAHTSETIRNFQTRSSLGDGALTAVPRIVLHTQADDDDDLCGVVQSLDNMHARACATRAAFGSLRDERDVLQDSLAEVSRLVCSHEPKVVSSPSLGAAHKSHESATRAEDSVFASTPDACRAAFRTDEAKRVPQQVKQLHDSLVAVARLVSAPPTVASDAHTVDAASLPGHVFTCLQNFRVAASSYEQAINNLQGATVLTAASDDWRWVGTEEAGATRPTSRHGASDEADEDEDEDGEEGYVKKTNFFHTMRKLHLFGAEHADMVRSLCGMTGSVCPQELDITAQLLCDAARIFRELLALARNAAADEEVIVHDDNDEEDAEDAEGECLPDYVSSVSDVWGGWAVSVARGNEWLEKANAFVLRDALCSPVVSTIVKTAQLDQKFWKAVAAMTKGLKYWPASEHWRRVLAACGGCVTRLVDVVTSSWIGDESAAHFAKDLFGDAFYLACAAHETVGAVMMRWTPVSSLAHASGNGCTNGAPHDAAGNPFAGGKGVETSGGGSARGQSRRGHATTNYSSNAVDAIQMSCWAAAGVCVHCGKKHDQDTCVHRRWPCDLPLHGVHTAPDRSTAKEVVRSQCQKRVAGGTAMIRIQQAIDGAGLNGVLTDVSMNAVACLRRDIFQRFTATVARANKTAHKAFDYASANSCITSVRAAAAAPPPGATLQVTLQAT